MLLKSPMLPKWSYVPSHSEWAMVAWPTVRADPWVEGAHHSPLALYWAQAPPQSSTYPQLARP